MSHETSKDKDCEVVINGTLVELEDDTLTYEELGELAFPAHDPQALFTVTYRNSNSSHGGSGTLVAGETVKVKRKGTSFNVQLTTRS